MTNSYYASRRRETTFRDHALLDRDHHIGGFDDRGRRIAGLKSELFGGFIGDRSGHDEG